MLVNVVMPKCGLTMVEGSVIRWRCKEGDVVAEGDAIVEIETEKANIEVPALDAGRIVRLIAEVGSVIPVGEPLAILEIADRPNAHPAESTTASSEADVQQPAGTAVAPTAKLEKPSAEREVRASPLARRVARELGVDWTLIAGTGPGGLVTETDVRAALRSNSAASNSLQPVRIERLTPMRKAIATAMSRSAAEAPQVTLTREAGMRGVSALRKELSQLNITDVIVAVVARVLKRHLRLNAHLFGEEIRLFDTVNIALAIALENGLVTPVLHAASQKDLAEIAAERHRLLDKARNNSFRPLDFEGGTFTITNLGPYDINTFTPILNLPQVATLGVGAAGPRAAVADNALVVREICPLSLTFDHRALDGAPAAVFLADLANSLDDLDLLKREFL
jgi:pyruvate dehydrogenase E2 component (dihydrolipoamide acetyltransferase)